MSDTDAALMGGEAKTEGQASSFPAHSASSTMKAAKYTRVKTTCVSSLPQRYGGIHYGGMYHYRDGDKAHDRKSP